MASSTDSPPLRSACTAWLGRINRAKEAKGEDFTRWANEGMQFFLGEREAWKNHMSPGGERTNETDIGGPNPKFKFILAKTQELVQIFGPMLYNRNPARTCTVRTLPEIDRALIVDPALEKQAQQLQQQLQQMQQQMQQAMQPPGQPPQGQGQPGQPPQQGQQPPQQPDPQMFMQYQQLQQQMQQLQQQIQQADQMYQQMVESQQSRTRVASARAKWIQSYLNYTPNEFDLADSFRKAIDEALIKGMGTVWTVAKKTPTGKTAITTEYESVDDLVIDPDAESWKEVKWIARRCVHWVYDVAEDYDLDVQELKEKATFETATSQPETAEAMAVGDPDSREDRSKDMMIYWKIWSRVGFGDRLPGVPEEYREALRGFGDNLYLVVARGIDAPLNFSTEDARRVRSLKRKKPKSEEEQQQIQGEIDDLFMKVQWPIPLHIDNKWPVTPIKFHDIPNTIWPMAHMRTSLPYLKFLNWQMSFLADHVSMTGRLFAATTKGLDDEVKNAILGGDPVTILELSAANGEKLSEILQFMTAPQGGTSELFAATQQINGAFEKASGLTELSYATPGGMRSAAEAQIKENVRNIRPDDMADKVETAATEAARKEALAMIWLLDGDDVAPVLGEPVGQLWDQLVAAEDPTTVAAELDFRIEEGTAKKPNKDKLIADTNMLIQSLGSQLSELIKQGKPGPWNALMRRMCEVNDIVDFEPFLIPPPPPPQPPPPDPRIEMQKRQAEADLQKTQAEIQLAQLKVQNQAQIANINLNQRQMGLAIDQAKAQQDMQQDQQRFEQEQNQTLGRMQLEQIRAQQMAAARQPMMPQQGV